MTLPSFLVQWMVLLWQSGFHLLVGRLKSVGHDGLGFSVKTASLAPCLRYFSIRNFLDSSWAMMRTWDVFLSALRLRQTTEPVGQEPAVTSSVWDAWDDPLWLRRHRDWLFRILVPAMINTFLKPHWLFWAEFQITDISIWANLGNCSVHNKLRWPGFCSFV